MKTYKSGNRCARAALLAGLALLAPGLAAGTARAQTSISEATWGGAGSEVTAGIAASPDGGTYVAGYTFSFGDAPPDIFLLRFAADGSLAWQRTWAGPGAFTNDLAADVAAAPDGSVYVVGSTTGVGGDAVVLKFAPDGSLAWQRTWGGAANDSAEAVAVAPDGSVYVTGSTNSFGTGSSDVFALRFTPEGDLVWQKTWGNDGFESGQGVAVAPDGSVYVAGVVSVPETFGADVALLKLDPAGNLVWQRTYASGTAGDIADARGGVTVAPDGSIYVAGGLQEPDLNALLLKFAPNGRLLWQRKWGGRSGDDAADVTVVADGSVVLAGTTNSFGAGSDDAFVVQLQPNGRATGAATWGGPGADQGAGAVVAADGTVSLAATTETPPHSLLRAPSKVSRLRGSLATPAIPLADISGTTADAAGTVAAPDGSGGGFDAALVTFTF